MFFFSSSLATSLQLRNCVCARAYSYLCFGVYNACLLSLRRCHFLSHMMGAQLFSEPMTLFGMVRVSSVCPSALIGLLSLPTCCISSCALIHRKFHLQVCFHSQRLCEVRILALTNYVIHCDTRSFMTLLVRIFAEHSFNACREKIPLASAKTLSNFEKIPFAELDEAA